MAEVGFLPPEDVRFRAVLWLSIITILERTALNEANICT
jgi:hypothetical protein